MALQTYSKPHLEKSLTGTQRCFLPAHCRRLNPDSPLPHLWAKSTAFLRAAFPALLQGKQAEQQRPRDNRNHRNSLTKIKNETSWFYFQPSAHRLCSKPSHKPGPDLDITAHKPQLISDKSTTTWLKRALEIKGSFCPLTTLWLLPWNVS